MTLEDTNPKAREGARKPEIHAVPPAALLHLGRAMADGERKYGLFNWRKNPISSLTYIDAGLRHKLSWADGEDYAHDSGIHHLAHEMACNAILLDAIEGGWLNDNRGPKGTFAEVVDAWTMLKEPSKPKGMHWKDYENLRGLLRQELHGTLTTAEITDLANAIAKALKLTP